MLSLNLEDKPWKVPFEGLGSGLSTQALSANVWLFFLSLHLLQAGTALPKECLAVLWGGTKDTLKAYGFDIKQ